MDYFTPLYQRSQIEVAIWQAYKIGVVGSPAQMPKSMSVRIKKLLELDTKYLASSANSFAFSSNIEIGQGHNRHFSIFDSYCLLIALQLIDHGTKQSDVLFLLQHLRPILYKHFDNLCNAPDAFLNVIDANEYPHLPSIRMGHVDAVDANVFLVFSQIEFWQAYGLEKDLPDHEPIIFGPHILYGLNKLKEFLDQGMKPARHCSIIEIRQCAIVLKDILPQISPKKRGKSSQERMHNGQ